MEWQVSLRAYVDSNKNYFKKLSGCVIQYDRKGKTGMFYFYKTTFNSCSMQLIIFHYSHWVTSVEKNKIVFFSKINTKYYVEKVNSSVGYNTIGENKSTCLAYLSVEHVSLAVLNQKKRTTFWSELNICMFLDVRNTSILNKSNLLLPQKNVSDL